MRTLGVGALIRNEAKEILLLLRRESPEKDKWSIPGGEIDPDETPDQALSRELKEELGVDTLLTRYVGAFQYEADDTSECLSLLFEARLKGPPVNEEPQCHSRLAWFKLDSLPDALSGPARFAIRNLDNSKTDERPAAPRAVGPADVVLIQPFFPLADKEALSLPLGLTSIHSVIKERGHRVATFDCSLPSDYINLVNQLVSMAPRIVGVQFHSDMSLDWSLRACRFVRRNLPSALIVAGGELANSKSRLILKEGYADVVVRGEGEVTFLEVVEAVMDGRSLAEISGLELFDDLTKDITKTPGRSVVKNLDDLPLPEIADLSWREYGQWTIFTSRGCPYKCMYCSSAAYWKHAIRYNSPSRVVREISRLVYEYGASDIYIADDTFTLDKGRVREICRLLVKQSVPVRWSCLTRADCIDEALMIEMRAAGCVLVSFGIESGNQSTLDLVDKHLSFDTIEDTLRICSRIGLRSRASVIIGLPGETERDVMSTLGFLLRTQPNEIQIYGLTPHDGTALYDNLQQLGVTIIEPDPFLWSRDVLRPVCETDQLKKDQIIELAHRFIEALKETGYIYLSPEMDKKKIGAFKTVATSFSPVQAIGSISTPAQAISS